MTLYRKVSYFAIQSTGTLAKGTGTAVAIAGAVTGVVSDVAPSAVTGAFGGLVCIACAAIRLRRALRRGRGLSKGGLRNG